MQEDFGLIFRSLFWLPGQPYQVAIHPLMQMPDMLILGTTLSAGCRTEEAPPQEEEGEQDEPRPSRPPSSTRNCKQPRESRLRLEDQGALEGISLEGLTMQISQMSAHIRRFSSSPRQQSLWETNTSAKPADLRRTPQKSAGTSKRIADCQISP